MSVRYEKSEDEQPQLSPEEFLEEQKKAIRKRSFWFLGAGIIATTFFLSSVALGLVTLDDLFHSILFVLGIFILIGGVWGFFYAKNLALEDLIPSPEAIDFLRQGQLTKPYFSYVLVGSLVAVSLAQFATGINESIESAGFVKSLFSKNHEYWRILTGGALHGSILHLYFNGQALYGFGSLIESLSNRAHLAIVFLLAVIGGGLFSLVFMPETATIGASGGIMGLIGYLAIYGYRRKRQLPPDFLKSMLINVGFIAAFGVIAYQIVDNFAHLGGFLTGAVYGFVQIPKDLHKNPRVTGNITKVFGFIALGVFIFTCVLSILLILKIIRL